VSLCCVGMYTIFSNNELFENNIIILFSYTNVLGISSLMTYRFIEKYHGNHDANNSTIGDTITFTMLFCLAGPLVEEYFFRHAIKNDLNTIFNGEYVMHLTSILFGLIHSFNYFAIKYLVKNEDKTLPFKVISQIIHTTLLGYICFLTNSFMYCVFFHSYYNTFVLMLQRYSIQHQDLAMHHLMSRSISPTMYWFPKDAIHFKEKQMNIKKFKFLKKCTMNILI
jgi:membrane protease YdiL (CAAX protease family)